MKKKDKGAEIIEMRTLISLDDDEFEQPTSRKEKIKKLFKKKSVIIGIGLALALVVGGSLYLRLATFESVKITAFHGNTGGANNRYQEFQRGLIKYGKDGASYINYKGEENWNHPYQIPNPVVEITGSSGIIANNGGNEIIVFDESGVKGEVTTTLPIEKVTVSSQGIVGVLMRDGSSPIVMCYDAQGNILVEHKVSALSTGYPLDISLSKSGEKLFVSYMQVEEQGIKSKMIHYSFDEEGRSQTDNVVSSVEKEDLIIPSVHYIGETLSMAVADQALFIFEGKGTPQLKQELTIEKEIRSVFWGGKYVGMILKSNKSEGNELRIFNSSGDVVCSEEFQGDFANAKISGNQVFLYEGEECLIFTIHGHKIFEGSMEQEILDIIPIWGVNKYAIVSLDGIKEVVLRK